MMTGFGHPLRSRFSIPGNAADLVALSHHADLDAGGELGWEPLYGGELAVTRSRLADVERCQFYPPVVLDRATHRHVRLATPPTTRPAPAGRQATARVAPPGYRARRPADFFAATDPLSLTGPITGPLGSSAVFDYTSLTYAKVSGQVYRAGSYGPYLMPWGGHATTYRTSLHLGVLEGLERIACERPEPPSTLRSDLPEGTRRYGPADFGVDPDGWVTPPPTDPTWVLGTSLVTGEEVALPARLVYHSLQVGEAPWVQETSNGMAIGGTAREAQLFGMLEAIERDSFVAAWYGRIPLTPIEVDSVADPGFRTMVARLKLAGQRLVLLDGSVGVPIPTIIAIAIDPCGRLCVGAGAHPDPVRAASSALTEVASDFQIAAHRYEVGRQRIEEMNEDYTLVRAMEDHADLFTRPGSDALADFWLETDTSPIAIAELATGGPHTVDDDLEFVVEQCSAEGFEPISVDCTTSLATGLGAHCWKTMIPGLIPIDFGPAQRVLHMLRLTELAVKRAGVSEPNPIPHPFP